jgi:hypothetical protein
MAHLEAVVAALGGAEARAAEAEGGREKAEAAVLEATQQVPLSLLLSILLLLLLLLNVL